MFIYTFVVSVQHLFDEADIDYTHYIRTTTKEHVLTVHKFWVCFHFQYYIVITPPSSLTFFVP